MLCFVSSVPRDRLHIQATHHMQARCGRTTKPRRGRASQRRDRASSAAPTTRACSAPGHGYGEGACGWRGGVPHVRSLPGLAPDLLHLRRRALPLLSLVNRGVFLNPGPAGRQEAT